MLLCLIPKRNFLSGPYQSLKHLQAGLQIISLLIDKGPEQIKTYADAMKKASPVINFQVVNYHMEQVVINNIVSFIPVGKFPSY